MKEQTVIKHYTPAQWVPLWQLRFAHLAEQGIIVPDDAIPAVPGLPAHDMYERDLNRIDEVYFSGSGGFWLAWQHEEPVGYVGGQDLGGVIELRRMYVRATHRRQGIGAQLVQALIDHCRANSMQVIELWTEENGLGQSIYTRLGFQQVPTPGPGFEAVDQATQRAPNPDEIRMQLTLYRHQGKSFQPLPELIEGEGWKLFLSKTIGETKCPQTPIFTGSTPSSTAFSTTTARSTATPCAARWKRVSPTGRTASPSWGWPPKSASSMSMNGAR